MVMKKFLYLLLLLPLGFLASCDDGNDVPDVDINVTFDNVVKEDGILYVVQDKGFAVRSVTCEGIGANALISSVTYYWGLCRRIVLVCGSVHSGVRHLRHSGRQPYPASEHGGASGRKVSWIRHCRVQGEGCCLRGGYSRGLEYPGDRGPQDKRSNIEVTIGAAMQMHAQKIPINL